MEKVAFLPLGSVVILKGTVKTILIIQRGINVLVNEGDDEPQYFDYGAALYPEGQLENQSVYFNHDDILEVVFKGYSNDDDKLYVKQLNDALSKLDENGQVDPFAGLKEKAEAEAEG